MSNSSNPGAEICMRNHLSLYITLIQLLYLGASSNMLSSTRASYSNIASFYQNLKFHILMLLSQQAMYEDSIEIAIMELLLKRK